MSHLTDDVRAASVAKLREAADVLERGDEIAAGKMLLVGLKPIALDLKRKYGPIVNLMVKSWIRGLFDE